ncbi:MAG: hypothetical protein HUJ76_12840, partial [Parasporobacterium sp.]|nr:hypothetical protein [Parasporobacterium sp.]
TGIAQKADRSSTKWYYVKDGAYIKATGLAYKADGSSRVQYYVENGAFKKITGTKVIGGKICNIVNGVLSE